MEPQIVEYESGIEKLGLFRLLYERLRVHKNDLHDQMTADEFCWKEAFDWDFMSPGDDTDNGFALSVMERYTKVAIAIEVAGARLTFDETTRQHSRALRTETEWRELLAPQSTRACRIVNAYI